MLTAIGKSPREADETIRISLSEQNQHKDISYMKAVIADIIAGKTPQIRVIKPALVDRNFLFDPENYILDIRFWYERKILKSMPNAHEVSLLQFKDYIHNIPKDKNIIVVCMGGIDATALAYTLYGKGYKNISIILSGLVGWRIAQPVLYQDLAGQNVTQLEK